MKYPCNKCLVSMICKDSCEEFGLFAQKLNDLEDKLGEFFGGIDDFILCSNSEWLGNVYIWIGNKILNPIFLLFIYAVYRVKIELKNETLFNVRYDNWEDRESKK